MDIKACSNKWKSHGVDATQNRRTRLFKCQADASFVSSETSQKVLCRTDGGEMSDGGEREHR